MKHTYLIALFVLAITDTCFAQTTETFETEAEFATTFTDNGRTFSVSSTGELYDVYVLAGAGWNGSSTDNRFVDNSGGANNNGVGNGTGFTITAVGGFNFTVKELYLFCSQINLTTHSGTLTITGKIGPTTVYTITKSSGFSNTTTFSPYNGFTKIDFATEGGSDYSDDVINELVFSSTGNLDYMALDAFRWAEALVPTWDGSTSTDWNVGSNWNTNAVPTATDNVIIPSAPSNQPHVTLAPGTPAVCADLTIESGATLTIDAGKALTVSGATANAGTILIAASASGIGSFIDNGTITGAGSFQMQQYLTGSGGGTPDGVFYYVSSPIPNATAAVYGIPANNKLWIDQEPSQNYAQLTLGTIPLEIGQGYIARMGSTGTITFDGSSFNTGNQSETGLTRTGTTELNRGFNLVGNPYPSTVNWNAASTTNLEASIWYRTHNGSGTMTFDTYNLEGPGIGTNNNGSGNVSNLIPPTQAFWVKVNADGQVGSLAFDNTDRSHGTLAGIYKAAAEEGTIRMTLSDGNASDEAIVRFDLAAQDAFDNYDSHKFWASNIPQLYMNVSEDTLVINGLTSTLTNPTVPLGVKLPTQGNYSLDATSITVVGENIHLEDTYLNIFQDLNVEPNYAFTSVAGNVGDRFILHFGMAAVGIEDGVKANSRAYASSGQLNIILSENTEKGNVQVLDMAGRIILTVGLNASRTTLDMNTSTGIYLIRIQTEKGTDTHRVILN